MDEFVHRFPALLGFDGRMHDRHIQLFQALDRARVAEARRDTVRMNGTRVSETKESDPAYLTLQGECAKSRGRRSIRRIVSEAGDVIQVLKPIVFLSPASIAKFLEPGGIGFDLVVFDEASQIRPEEALGGILRARQVVIVGDSHQLPPTSFFITSGSEETADPTGSPMDRDSSILDHGRRAGFPQYHLVWHYRARHHSLMAVANREIYDGCLRVPPSPDETSGRFGLRFHHVTDGYYDRGGTAAHAAEAQTVVDAIIDHARYHPEQSLGVCAFSIAQQRAIADALENRLAEDPENPEFFSIDRPEPIFIKNLETVQGDERDVVFLSVGYGRDNEGKLPMNFGPLSLPGGERRFNVMMTRARERCEVFSSITAADVDHERCQGRGPIVLKAFLDAAERGFAPEGKPLTAPGKDSFLEVVATAVRSAGFQTLVDADPSRQFIDLAVAHPDREGDLLLGIQVDGFGFQSLAAVRDREWVRRQTLTDRGWRLHRIWALDWLNRPQEEAKRLLEAIQQALLDSQPSMAVVPFVGPEEVASGGGD